MRRENIIVGSMCILAYMCLIVPAGLGVKVSSPTEAKGTGSHLSDKKPSERASEPSRGYSDADYYQPLENWLKAKGSPLSGKDFYEVAKQYKLDPDFLIAVTKAETQLCTVKQRGSEFNCGSVGSYDSTNTTYRANSYRHGIEQIAQTVNNQYLSRYTKISELSRSHNRNQNPVYATSDGNWFRNVRDTMNSLKGTHEPDFLFRRP